MVVRSNAFLCVHVRFRAFSCVHVRSCAFACIRVQLFWLYLFCILYFRVLSFGHARMHAYACICMHMHAYECIRMHTNAYACICMEGPCMSPFRAGHTPSSNSIRNSIHHMIRMINSSSLFTFMISMIISLVLYMNIQ